MLGQCMPGPTSTQMGFAQGILKKGLTGGLVSGALFQGPGLLILSALGWALADTLAKNIEWLNGLVSGLAAAGIALVAGAAVNLNSKINSTRELQIISTTSAVIAFYWPQPWTFPYVFARGRPAPSCYLAHSSSRSLARRALRSFSRCLILLGGLTTMILSKVLKRPINVPSQKNMNAGVERLGFNKLGGGILLALWIAVLIAVLVAAGQTAYVDQKELHWFAAFYRTGSIIFGGGQVVLPMLYNDVVAADCAQQDAICCPIDPTQVADPIGNTTAVRLNQTLIDLCSDYSTALYASECKCSWMSASQFYFGLSLAQAMPGPLFNFSAYLGAVIAQNAGVFAIAGIALCWVGLFAPGLLIIFAILPFWGGFRAFKLYRTALPGLNSAAVGLIISSVFQLGTNAYVSSSFPVTSICIGIACFGFSEVVGVPAPFIVMGGAAAGVVAWAIPMQ